MKPPGLDEAWSDYLSDPSIKNRNRVATLYWPLVNKLARVQAGKLIDAVDADDLAQMGALGLLDAMERFQPERGISFTTFASRRIHGAMIDGLRDECDIPRIRRRRIRRREDATDQFRVTNGRPPTPAELVKMVGTKAAGASWPKHESLNHTLFNDEGKARAAEGLFIDRQATDPADAAEVKDSAAHAMQIIKTRCGDRTASMVREYYQHGVTMRQIGDQYETVETRVSQLLEDARRVVRGEPTRKVVKAMQRKVKVQHRDLSMID